jgi:hypothetical protein
VFIPKLTKNKEIASGYTPSPWFEKEILKTPTTNAGKIKLLSIRFSSATENLITKKAKI